MHDSSINGDVIFDIEKLVVQWHAAKRKKWWALGQFRLPTTFSERAFWEAIAVGLVEAFKGGEPVEFVNLVDISRANGLTVYRLSSHHTELTGTIGNRMQRMVSEMLEPDFDAAESRAKHNAEVAATLGGFQISGSLDLSQRFNCLRLRCDPRSKTASILPFTARSTRPQDYPEQLETTSELLEYVAAILNSGGLITDIGDPFWVSSYAWVKFMASFLDERSISLGRIQVNAVDPEEWNFINPELDYEIKNNKRIRG